MSIGHGPPSWLQQMWALTEEGLFVYLLRQFSMLRDQSKQGGYLLVLPVSHQWGGQWAWTMSIGHGPPSWLQRSKRGRWLSIDRSGNIGYGLFGKCVLYMQYGDVIPWYICANLQKGGIWFIFVTHYWILFENGCLTIHWLECKHFMHLHFRKQSILSERRRNCVSRQENMKEG